MGQQDSGEAVYQKAQRGTSIHKFSPFWGLTSLLGWHHLVPFSASCPPPMPAVREFSQPGKVRLRRDEIGVPVNTVTIPVRADKCATSFIPLNILFLLFTKKCLLPALPYGQLPIYEEDGRVLNQSIAIARYVASQTGLLPTDPWEQAKLDAAVLTIYDLIKKLATFFYAQDPEEKEKLKKQVLEDVDYYYSRFEKELHAGGGYFGGKLSWADFILVNTTELLNLQLNQTVNTKYPAITALISEIYANPGVKEYLANKKSSAPVS
ncbi:glutathione S-transferase-like [Ostrinia furnacalis]|uniref:glutathione S-transferase-like n=1 Tax=Ostrinia furnacalis TaxID=93504 RepID=UPI00103B81B3|nr:glutathione S-transferase-like [Ostrinia furnacalis]